MKNNIKHLFCWYLTGFVLGIIGGNLLFRETGYPSGILAVYGAAVSKELINAETLFGHLLFQRGVYFLFMIFIGLTYMGFFAVILSLLWFSFLAGNLLTIFVLEYGLKGLPVGISCFLPQIFFYLPGWIVLFWLVMRMSRKSWKKGKRERADYQAYTFWGLVAGICVLLGIWLESYVNPNILIWIFQHWI